MVKIYKCENITHAKQKSRNPFDEKRIIENKQIFGSQIEIILKIGFFA